MRVGWALLGAAVVVAAWKWGRAREVLAESQAAINFAAADQLEARTIAEFGMGEEIPPKSVH